MHHIPRILFAGGGTGGHVYPAVAIADAIRILSPRAAIEFAGTRDRMEWEAVPKAGYAIHAITVSGFQRSLSAKNFAFPFKLMKGLGQSIQLVKAFDPHVVVGTGGYVSGPVLWAAGRQGIPTVLQEQNAYAGVTNRLLARKARRIHVAFEEARRYFPTEKCRLTGNPIRKSLLESDRKSARESLGIPEDVRLLFFFGGSLGSIVLNDALLKCADELVADPRLYVLWQAGRRHFEDLRSRAPVSKRIRLVPYVDDMHHAYAAADLVIARAGAITCSELMATGTPAILVPSPHLAEDHQSKNARAMTETGASEMLPESELDRLGSAVRVLISNQEKLSSMSDAARAMAKPDAARTIAADVLEIAGFNSPAPEFTTG